MPVDSLTPTNPWEKYKSVQPAEQGPWTKYAQPLGRRSKFGGVPVDDSPQQSKFGGIPVEETPRQSGSKFGGIPVDEASAWKPVPEPFGGTPPDAGAQMRQSAIEKIPAELGGFQPRSRRIFHTGVPNIDRPPVMPPLPAFESGHGQQIVEGFERAAEPGFDNKAAGASGMIRGLGRAAAGGALPLLGGGLVSAPLATIGGAVLGGAGAAGGGKLARLGAQKLGGGEGAQDLAQDVGEGVGGAVAGPPLIKLIGKGVQAPAGPIAETALGIRKLDRAYGKTPGQAVLDETSGFRPSTIAKSAQSKLHTLNTQLEDLADSSTQPASLIPALKVLGDAESKATSRNSSGILKQLTPMREHLTTNTATGLPLSPTQTSRGLLNLKRGFGDEFIHGPWNPETMSGTRSTAARTYGALDSELDRTVPEASELNQRVSSLIPVARRAESVDRGAGGLQQALGKIAKPTGALVGAIEGFRHAGIPGAIAGLGIPAVISSPTIQMVTARGLNATGNSLQEPAAAAAARLIPLLKPRRPEGGALTPAAKRAQGSPGSR